MFDLSDHARIAMFILAQATDGSCDNFRFAAFAPSLVKDQTITYYWTVVMCIRLLENWMPGSAQSRIRTGAIVLFASLDFREQNRPCFSRKFF